MPGSNAAPPDESDNRPVILNLHGEITDAMVSALARFLLSVGDLSDETIDTGRSLLSEKRPRGKK